MEYYPATKKNEAPIDATRWINHENYANSKKAVIKPTLSSFFKNSVISIYMSLSPKSCLVRELN